MRKYDNSELVMAVKVYQRSRNTHSLTCGKDSNHFPLQPKVVDGWVVLYCMDCDYEQEDFPVETVMTYFQRREQAKARMDTACLKCREKEGYFDCQFNGQDCPYIHLVDWKIIHDENIADMAEMKNYFERGILIKEWLCPNFDIPHPKRADLDMCESGKYCENHWGCHTFRHFMGSREESVNDDGEVE